MTIEIKHPFECLKSDGPDATVVKPSDWNEAHDITMAHSFILGREAGTNGSVQELPVKITSGGDVTFSAALGYFLGALGTTVQRPVSPLQGMERTNVTTTKKEWYDGATWQNSATEAYTSTYVQAYVSSILSVPSGFLFGLELSTSTSGGSSTFSVGAGKAANSTAASLITRAAISKTTSAWAVGNNQGSLDAGTIANNTWYHVYVIAKADLSVSDICISTNASVPTPLPTDYTLYRRIGTIRTDSSAKWRQFLQDGNNFYIPAVTQFSLSGTASNDLRTVDTPLGIKTTPILYGTAGGSASSAYATVGSGLNSAIKTSVVFAGIGVNAYGVTGPAAPSLPTNNSSQLYFSYSNSGAVEIFCSGWVDSRGRES